MRPLVIGTRGSALALWQAEHIAERLRTAHPGLSVRLSVIKTKGDRIIDRPLAAVGGKGLFIKEIEDALLSGAADLAVHSMKDMPVEGVAGLAMTAIVERADARDALVARDAASVETLGAGAIVGTSSLRRRCQLLALRPDLDVRDLRGNVDTRLRKLDEGHYDAVILAAAGLDRLGLGDRICERLHPDRFLPAVSQGAIGVQTRADDESLNPLVQALHHDATAVCVSAERRLLTDLAGDCHVPVAAYATIDDDRVALRALAGTPDGTRLVRAAATGSTAAPDAVGAEAAVILLRGGAGEILAALSPSRA